MTKKPPIKKDHDAEKELLGIRFNDATLNSLEIWEKKEGKGKHDLIREALRHWYNNEYLDEE